MVPPSQPSEDSWDEPLPDRQGLEVWVRVLLVLMALGLAAVFAVAIYLDPYRGGQPLRMETHRQLGLPECTFKEMTRLPCPSCGMTTSFALMVRGDVWNAAQANFVGALLAAGCMLALPWSLACVVTGRYLFVRSLERTLTRLVVAFFLLMLLRWVVVLLLL
jgi:hypothetical protein